MTSRVTLVRNILPRITVTFTGKLPMHHGMGEGSLQVVIIAQSSAGIMESNCWDVKITGQVKKT